MSLAADARQAARTHPFLLDALRAGVVNYTAAAEFLDLGRDDAGTEAIATALRRYAEELEPRPRPTTDVPVRMQRGVSLSATDGDPKGEADEVVVRVGDQQVVRGGEMTAIRASGDLGTPHLEHVLARLRTASVVSDAAGIVGGDLVVVVPRRQGATALRHVEAALKPADG